jgi:hypothetical protein
VRSRWRPASRRPAASCGDPVEVAEVVQKEVPISAEWIGTTEGWWTRRSARRSPGT